MRGLGFLKGLECVFLSIYIYIYIYVFFSPLFFLRGVGVFGLILRIVVVAV